jgi:hypothetical protein
LILLIAAVCPLTSVTDADHHEVLLVAEGRVIADVADSLPTSCDERGLRLGGDPALVLSHERGGWQLKGPPVLQAIAEGDALFQTMDSLRTRSGVTVSGRGV